MIMGNVAGQADVWAIWKDMTSGKYHPVFFEERPMPGPIKPIVECDFLRLKSKMHHTGGLDTLEEAQAELRSCVERLRVDETNVVSEPIVWDGIVAYSLAVRNWRRDGNALTAADLGTPTH